MIHSDGFNSHLILHSLTLHPAAKSAKENIFIEICRIVLKKLIRCMLHAFNNKPTIFIRKWRSIFIISEKMFFFNTFSYYIYQSCHRFLYTECMWLICSGFTFRACSDCNCGWVHVPICCDKKIILIPYFFCRVKTEILCNVWCTQHREQANKEEKLNNTNIWLAIELMSRWRKHWNCLWRAVC